MYYAYRIAVKIVKGFYSCLYRVLERFLRRGTRPEFYLILNTTYPVLGSAKSALHPLIDMQWLFWRYYKQLYVSFQP